MTKTAKFIKRLESIEQMSGSAYQIGRMKYNLGKEMFKSAGSNPKCDRMRSIGVQLITEGAAIADGRLGLTKHSPTGTC